MKGDKTKLLRGDGAEPEVFTEVAEILEIGDIKISRDMSVIPPTFGSDGYEGAHAGAKKVDPIDIKVRYSKDEEIAALINGDFESDDPVNYQIHWPDSPQTKKQIALFVSGVTMTTPQYEDVTETFSFQPHGKVINVA